MRSFSEFGSAPTAVARRSKAWRSRQRYITRAFWRGVRGTTGPPGLAAMCNDTNLAVSETDADAPIDNKGYELSNSALRDTCEVSDPSTASIEVDVVGERCGDPHGKMVPVAADSALYITERASINDVLDMVTLAREHVQYLPQPYGKRLGDRFSIRIVLECKSVQPRQMLALEDALGVDPDQAASSYDSEEEADSDVEDDRFNDGVNIADAVYEVANELLLHSTRVPRRLISLGVHSRYAGFHDEDINQTLDLWIRLQVYGVVDEQIEYGPEWYESPG